jgi:TolB protein
MRDLRTLLERTAERVVAPPDAFETLRRRRRARQLRVRLAAAATALVVATAGIGVAAIAFRHHAPLPPAATLPGNGTIVFDRTLTAPIPYVPDTALFSAEPDGTGLRRITHDEGSHLYATVTSDAKRVAYVLQTPSPRGQRPATHDAIVVSSTDGSGRTVIHDCGAARCRDLAWSPDGTMIAFIEGDGSFDSLEVIDSDGGAERTLCSAVCGQFLMEPAWSPDGSTIVFAQDPYMYDGPAPVPSSIFTVRPDGLGLQRLTCIPSSGGTRCSQDVAPVWSPDGLLIAFDRRPSGFTSGPAGIFVMRPDGTGLHQVWQCPSTCGPFAWSPDGRELAVTRSPSTAVTIVSLAGQLVRRIDVCPPQACAYVEPVVWSPDGRDLLLEAFDSHGPIGLSVVREDGSGLHRVIESPAHDVNALVAWLPLPASRGSGAS